MTTCPPTCEHPDVGVFGEAATERWENAHGRELDTDQPTISDLADEMDRDEAREWIRAHRYRVETR